MNEDVGDAGIENPAFDPRLTEDEQRQRQTKQDPGLDLIPRCREGPMSVGHRLAVRAWFLDTAEASILLKAQDHPARTVASEEENLAER